MYFLFPVYALVGEVGSICSNRRTVKDVSPEPAQTPPAGLNAREIHRFIGAGKRSLAELYVSLRESYEFPPENVAFPGF